MKNKIFIILSLLLIMIFNVYSTQMIKGDNIKDSKSYEDDYMFTGRSLDFSGKADDIYFFGELLNFSGETKSSINGIGDKIILSGVIGDNINVGGRLVEISGIIKSNAYIAGQTIILQKGAVIDGTLFTASKELIVKNDAIINSGVISSNGSITLSGVVNGDIKIKAAELTIDGKINGNIDINAGKIIITNNSQINGNFKYTAEYKIPDSDLSKVKGNITFVKDNSYRHNKFRPFMKAPFTGCNKDFKPDFFKMMVFFKIFSLIGFIVAGLLLLLLPITKKIELDTKDNKTFWYTMLWGLIPFFIYPAAIIILFVLFITIPVGVLLLLIGLPLLVLTQIIGVVLFGQYLFSTFKWTSTNRYLFFLFGLIFYIILSIIPFIGLLSLIFFASLGWGQIIQGLFNKKFV